ncbi:octopamine receptor-like [Exaiptasia diaphana]|uniref:G-protein coupled receptors family 1 profile domain-containing protein n=1 Tax=Exaiptasia diaphana TaxID=2652724 RepID=A0A913XNU9_EXADI|nr:octopamine receptor-like [Exaiptasia diaphana]
MNSSNSSQGCAPHVITSHEIVAKILALSVIAVFDFLGNVLTIVVVCREKSLHNTVNYLMVNMAISDLIIPLIALPHMIFDLANSMDLGMWTVNGDFGIVLCKLFFFVADISPSVSILSLVIITVDRFFAVMFPLRAGIAPLKRVNKVLIALTWIVPALFLTPNLYSYNLIEHNDQTFCLSRFSENPVEEFKIQKILYTLIVVFFIILPFFVLIIMYTMILLKLRQQDRSAMAMSQSKKERVIRFQKTRRVVFMALTVIVVFAVCWMPLNAFVFLIYHVWEPSDRENMCFLNILIFVVRFLGYANPLFNPVIYFIFIEKFRRGLLNCLTCRKRMPIVTMMNSDGRENSGRVMSKSMAVFDGGSPRTRASSGVSLQLQTHKL